MLLIISCQVFALSCGKNYISSYFIPNNAVFALFLCILWYNLVIWACIAMTLSYLHSSIRDYKHLHGQKRATKAIAHCYQSIWFTTVQDWTLSFFPKCLYSIRSIIVLCNEENSLNKLIRMIQIFMRKYFVVQHYPRNIFNIGTTVTE